MRRLLALLLCLGLAISIGTGSLAHAAEPIGCLDATEASLLGHISGDSDQVPADSEKGYPHHHSGCQGHFVGVPVTNDSPLPGQTLVAVIFSSRSAALHAVSSESLRRPPRA
ncbi:hypothetical protein DFR49_2504 [Hephaestia caeni]|jgi:hypothetical protein|uniref:Uncharacterized protein n=1 Tax=Hephaestia caeni TaxID=645617 RepID=A0A397P7F6_9SPHN|nr:hypothetical protein [Hephaestia caeni]RIA44263.1 hypothetical protein DFR49_2504 [Hephaestia caeni]